MAQEMYTTDYLRALLGENTIGLIGGLGKKSYNYASTSYNKVSTEKSTDLRLIEMLMYKSLGYASEIKEGQNREYDKMQQLWKTDLYMQYFQKNYIATWQLLAHLASKAAITKNMIQSNVERGNALAMKKDRSFAQMLAAYDDTNQIAGDGLPLGSTAQLSGDGSTFSNLSASAADINEFSVEAAVKVIRQWVDTGGKLIKPEPRCIYSGTNLEFDGKRLLETEYTLNSNFNDKNIISTGKYLPEGHVISQHYPNDGSWFIVTDVEEGFVTFTFKEPMFDLRPVPGKYDTEYTALAGWVHGFNDKRGCFIYPRS